MYYVRCIQRKRARYPAVHSFHQNENELFNLQPISEPSFAVVKKNLSWATLFHFLGGAYRSGVKQDGRCAHYISIILRLRDRLKVTTRVPDVGCGVFDQR